MYMYKNSMAMKTTEFTWNVKSSEQLETSDIETRSPNIPSACPCPVYLFLATLHAVVTPRGGCSALGRRTEPTLFVCSHYAPSQLEAIETCASNISRAVCAY